MKQEAELIDNFLKQLIEKGKLSVVDISNKHYHSKEVDNAKNILISNQLIQNPTSTFKPINYVWITEKGRDIIEKFGGWAKYKEDIKRKEQKQQEKSDLEFEKTKVDLDLAKKTLKEFPKTKIRAKIALIIAVILAILQLAEWIISLLSKN